MITRAPHEQASGHPLTHSETDEQTCWAAAKMLAQALKVATKLARKRGAPEEQIAGANAALLALGTAIETEGCGTGFGVAELGLLYLGRLMLNDLAKDET